VALDGSDWTVIGALVAIFGTAWTIYENKKKDEGKPIHLWMPLTVTLLVVVLGVLHFGQKFITPHAEPTPGPADSSTQQAAKLEFTTPSEGQEVPRALPVALKGSVPPAYTLWIVVQSSGRYYLQGRAQEQGPLKEDWVLGGVILGSTDDPGDKNATYTILGVLAPPEIDADLTRDLTSKDSGLDSLPGGIPAGSPSRTVHRQG
jgi:hypothetical protein